METKEMIRANAPTLDVRTAGKDFSSQIPEYAIDRLARFFLPMMQASLAETKSAHLQQEQNDNMILQKEGCA